MNTHSNRANGRPAKERPIMFQRREGGKLAKIAYQNMIPPIGLSLAREVYLGRRKRERFLAADLFGEPTWDILLDLYIATGEGRRVPTTSACIGANVPPTTALRWLRILENRGLIAREDDGQDGRRTFVGLTVVGIEAMNALMLNWHHTMLGVAQAMNGESLLPGEPLGSADSALDRAPRL